MTVAALALCSCYNDYIIPRQSVVPEIPEETPQPTKEVVPAGGTLTVAVRGDSLNINPINTLNEDVIYCSSFFYEPLVRQGESMAPVPCLAEDWSSSDNITWTVRLRSCVKFHDGSLLTGDDVIATVNALKTSGGAYVACAEHITAVSCDGDNVIFELDAPDGLFPWKLFFPVLKAEGVNSSVPAGTGLFRFSEKAEDRLIFVRNDDYYGNKSKIDSLELRFFRDTADKAVSDCDVILLTGDAAIKYGSRLGYETRQFDDNSLICMIPYMYTGDTLKYVISDKLTIEQRPTNRQEALSVNMRRAVAEMIDRDRLIERTVSGWGKAYDWPVFDNCVFRKNVEIKSRSDAQAEKLLGLDGYTHEGGNKNWFRADDTEKNSPLTVRFLVSSDDVELIHACDSVVSRLKSIGIKTAVKAASGSEFTQLFLSGEYDYTFMRLNMGFSPDLADAFANGSIFNYNGYDAGWITDALLRVCKDVGSNGPEGSAAFAERYAEVLEEVWAGLDRDLPFVGLYVRRNCMLRSSRLNAGELTGTQSWNLFADIDGWYIV